MECENKEYDDFFGTGEYKPSGISCEQEGCDSRDAFSCVVDDGEGGDCVTNYCGKHAAENGYCCCCGNFCAGMYEFDFHHPGYCENCFVEVGGYDDDDDYYDY